MRILFVVEPEFLTRHVGVRRVILHYANRLKGIGTEVAFGTPKSGKIFLGDLRVSGHKDFSKYSMSPSWSTTSPKLCLDADISHQTNSLTISWTEQTADPDEYNANFITAPWVCALGIPPLPRMVGIIYDLVPNLIACGCLRLPNYLDIYGFAQEHDVGFRYYLANASRVTCISDSTRMDFLNLYRTAHQLPSLITDIPFTCRPNVPLAVTGSNTVMLVNALDWRKNLKNIERVLALAARRTSFKLCVVGEERVTKNEAILFLKNIATSGIEVEWYRNVDDEFLASQYLQASVLLFPSLYEGLGLPILEAQEVGVPAITSNVSSCAEINMNRTLCFEPNDLEGMATSLVDVLVGKSAIAAGVELRLALGKFFADRGDSISVFDLAGTDNGTPT